MTKLSDQRTDDKYIICPNCEMEYNLTRNQCRHCQYSLDYTSWTEAMGIKE